MNLRRRHVRVWLALGAALLAAAFAGSAQAAAAPLYDVKAFWGDTNLTPGGEGQFAIQTRNIGDQDGKGAITVVDQLPEGVKATHIAAPYGGIGEHFECSGLGTETVQCVLPEFWVSEFEGHGLARAPGTGGAGEIGSLFPTGYLPMIFIDVEIDPAATGTGVNTATVSGGGGPQPATDVDQMPFDDAPSSFGLVPGSFLADNFSAAYPFGEPVRQASARPFELRFNFDFNAKSAIGEDGTRLVAAHGSVKTVEVTLPRGMIGNPEALPKCDPVDFSEQGSTTNSTGCPANTQVGYVNIPNMSGEVRYGQGPIFNVANEVLSHVPIYNLEPPKGVPVDLAFNATFVQVHISGVLDPAQNYAIKSVTPNISSLVNVLGSEVTLWGVPGDPAHDRFRYYPQAHENGKTTVGAPFTGTAIRPYFTNPMDCGFDNGGGRIRVDFYQRPGDFSPVEEWGDPLNVTGCDDPRFRFEPDISLQPTSKVAGGPTGLDVHLEVPQRNDEAADAGELYAQNGYVKAIGTPPMKKVVVTFPEGMTINPAAAQGLGSCSPQQIGLGTDKPVTCPDSSQYGRLVLHTPLLPVDAQPEGFVYIAKQNDNPFHNFLSLYLVIEEPERGILFKLPGRADLDPQTGQITTTFDDIPQFPVSDMQMSLKGGLRAGLVNPQTCGKKTIEATFYSWHDPTTPHTVNSNYEVTQNQDGSPCFNSPSQRPFDPQLSGGTANNLAGAYSPMELRLTRSDFDQELSGVGRDRAAGSARLPEGVGRCSDAAIAASAEPRQNRDRRAEQPLLPRLEPRRFGGRGSRSRPGDHLRPRQGLPRRPL